MKLAFLILFFLFARVAFSQDTLRLSLLFTGDIMQHDSQIAAAFDSKNERYDYKPCFEKIKPTLSAPDLTFGNLELTFGGLPYKGYPQFSAPDELLEALKDAGFDVLVTANNHCVDRGGKGLERTIDLLDSAHILHTGTFKDTLDWLNSYPLMLEAKGFRLSLLNYTYGTNGLPVDVPNMVNRIDTIRIAHDLQKAREQHTDMIIVFMHWGKEYESMPNPWQKKLTAFCFQHGARIVIGSHPHVLQPVEWNQDQDHLVAYSLGNFVSGQRDRYRNGGMMLHVSLEKIAGKDAARIQDVSYSLEYVHRAQNPRRTYQILPVESFSDDSTVVKLKSARESLLQFRDDSRTLLGKENKNVRERIAPAQIPKDP